MRKKIVVIGAGGHSKVVCDLIELFSEEFVIYGLIDSCAEPNRYVNGYKIIGSEDRLADLYEEIDGGIVAIGDNWRRGMMVAKIKEMVPFFNFVTLIHPSSVISRKVTIGEGSVILAGAIINSNVSVGEHCIVNTRSSLDHDCNVGSFSSLAPGVTLGGKVIVGDYTAISLGANVIHSIKIGEHTVIGAGATVIRDVGSNVVAYGTPAKIKRAREVGEPYL